MQHDCPTSCLYCMVTSLYETIDQLKKDKFSLAAECFKFKKEVEDMDRKIKKVLSKEKGAVKETKELLRMDKKQDSKMKKMKKKGC